MYTKSDINNAFSVYYETFSYNNTKNILHYFLFLEQY
jgi:hypothetical protein